MENIMANYAVIRHYHFNSKDSASIDKIIKDLFVPLIKDCKGFVRYYWLDDGNGEAASIKLAAEFASHHLKDLIKQKPEIIEGLIVAHD